MTKCREMVKNGDDKEWIEYAEICITIIKQSMRRHEEMQQRDHMRNDHDIKELEESLKNPEARLRQTDHTHRQAV